MTVARPESHLRLRPARDWIYRTRGSVRHRAVPTGLPGVFGHRRPKRARVLRRASRRDARVVDRREVLAILTTGLAGTVGGCTWEPSVPDADVIAGPEGTLAFEPAELTVPVGETVTWGFASSGHNVSCRPGDSDEVGLPDDAEPFASYAPDESPRRSLVPRGETYDHTFDVAGEYVYACIPHVVQGMVGTIHVE